MPLEGLVTVTGGATASNVTVEVAVVVLPAVSVCAAVMALLPSPATKVTAVVKAPLLHVGVAPVATPLPAIVTAKPSSEQVPLTVTPLAEFKELPETGAEIATVGNALSTVSAVLLGPAAALVLPAVSVAIPAARLMVTVPFPQQLDKVTGRVDVPEPVTALLQLAVPVLFKVTLPATKETEPTPTESEKVRV